MYLGRIAELGATQAMFDTPRHPYTRSLPAAVPRPGGPDLICVMDSASGEAIGTETVWYGQRVTVIALPAPPLLLTDKGLKHVGPRAFGHDVDFRSVFAKDEK